VKFILKLTILTALLTATTYIGGCNTTKGAGKDMQSAGENISHAAEKNGAHN
jgi:predicted small secreted protein